MDASPSAKVHKFYPEGLCLHERHNHVAGCYTAALVLIMPWVGQGFLWLELAPRLEIESGGKFLRHWRLILRAFYADPQCWTERRKALLNCIVSHQHHNGAVIQVT